MPRASLHWFPKALKAGLGGIRGPRGEKVYLEDNLRGRQLGLVVELPLDVELDLLAGGQALHLDQDLVEVVQIELESHRRHHLDVQVLVLDAAKDVVDQLVEDGLCVRSK